MTKLEKFLIPSVILILAVLYLLLAQRLVQHDRLDVDHFSLLFESDPSRVIENSTSLFGDQARTRAHPLHILMVAPVGLTLTHLVGSSVWAAVLITAAAAAGVLFNVDHILREQLHVRPFDRLLFLLLLGLSASHVSFGAAIPETHVLSAFALSMMVRCMSRARLARMRENEHSLSAWLRAGGAICLLWAAAAMGMLVTSAALLPIFAFLLLDRTPPWQRVRVALLGTAAVGVTVLALHVAQRGLWPPVRGAAPTSIPSFLVQKHDGSADTIAHWRTEESAGVRGKFDYIVHAIKSNTTWATPLDELPRRVPHLLNTAFVNAFYAPRFTVKDVDWSEIPAVTFEPWSSRHRPVGAVGALAWLGLIVALTASRRHKLRQLCLRPGVLFVGIIALYYLIVFTLYGDELFLFSPNWAFALVVLAAALYAQPKGSERTQRHQKWRRVALATAVLCLTINSAMHVRDLLAVYA